MVNKRIAVALATSALVFNSLATTAFAASEVILSGNGSNSNNAANLNLTRSQSVVQNNTANISNNVNVDAKTGDNKANDNTGGDVSIDTGKAKVSVGILNQANKNVAEVGCCPGGDTSLKILDNGSDSDNDIDLDMENRNSVFQDNDAYVNNDVDVDADTGDNEANDNTNGDVEIDTGDVNAEVSLFTLANLNLARIGGGDNGSNGGKLNLWISGNGSDSDNNIDADIENSSTVNQTNDADVYNDVDLDADTGDNEAEDNTGGEVSIDTGKVDAAVGVENVANFNWADLSCGCLFDDLTAKIAGNGDDTDNDINLDLSDGEKDGVWQDNDADLDNDLDDLKADTGDNEADDNTLGSEGGDPSITTGEAGMEVGVANSANFNTAGLGVELDFDWDLDDLLDMLGL